MVRVISVHHFTNQNIQTVEQPTACTIAPPNRLLLALTSNCIEVRDLKNEGEVLFTFPTVDEVAQIAHCQNGDYVVTLETKFNRQNKETNFVRIYINWDSVATLQQSKMTSSGVSLGSSECGMVQPMRARIAGRVTPTINQTELGSLEMIEIPVKRNPHLIECCQISGNIIILSNNILNFYNFVVKTHDISKLRFIDFEEMPFHIELAFQPNFIEIAENYIACMSKDSMHLFKLSFLEKNEASDNNFTDVSYSDDETIDYKKLINDEKLSGNTKITVNLPYIVRDNSIIHKNSPYTFCEKDLTATIHVQCPLEAKRNYAIKNLIQLKLIPIIVENAQRQISEEFKCLLLKPIYIEENFNKIHPQNRVLNSNFANCLNGVVCMIATQQDGYLYYFNENENTLNGDNCIAVYPFTAPVYKLVMENSFLHALTETGLESYTLRFGHQLCRTIETVDNVNIACPPIDDTICLVGLRPFLGVEQILLSENHLILLANSETSPTHSVSSNSSSNIGYWTLYNLELPNPKLTFNDISIVASVHRFSSPQTYCHLMSEAHVILRMALLLKKWVNTEENVKLILPDKNENDDIIESYRTSCALLADHFIMTSLENDYKLAIPYYKMAGITPFEVLKRVRKTQEQSNNPSTKGLVYYLKQFLIEIKPNEIDKIFSGGNKQNLSDAILELLENYSYQDLTAIILKSNLLREYSTDKLIQILTKKIKENKEGENEKFLALALLYIQKCDTDKAKNLLNKINKDDLQKIILQNWELLFDNCHNKTKTLMTFSELSVTLISLQPEIFSQILITLIDKKLLSLHRLIKVFLEYLPSSIESDSNSASLVLQKTLEMYFLHYFANKENLDSTKIMYEKGTSDAIKLLVRSYLSQIQILQVKKIVQEKQEANLSKIEKEILDEDENNEVKFDSVKHQITNRADKDTSYLFSNYRYEYLDKMPPFQIEITEKLYDACLDDYKIKNSYQFNEEADGILKKLQAILCSPVIPKQVMGEVNAFLSLNEDLRGILSLQSIIMNNHDAVTFLIDVCPQCLLQFGKDRFSRLDEWKFLVSSLQKRIITLSQNDILKRICFFHKKILKDVLTHLSTSLTLDELIQVFPQRIANNKTSENLDFNFDSEFDILNEIQNYEPFIELCKETMHANQIHKLITTTAQQLLNTLHL